MKIIKVVIGLVLIAIGVFAFLGLENAILKYVVGIVAAIAGLAFLILAFRGGSAAPVEGTVPVGGVVPVKKEVAVPVKV